MSFQVSQNVISFLFISCHLEVKFNVGQCWLVHFWSECVPWDWQLRGTWMLIMKCNVFAFSCNGGKRVVECTLSEALSLVDLLHIIYILLLSHWNDSPSHSCQAEWFCCCVDTWLYTRGTLLPAMDDLAIARPFHPVVDIHVLPQPKSHGNFEVKLSRAIIVLGWVIFLKLIFGAP